MLYTLNLSVLVFFLMCTFFGTSQGLRSSICPDKGAAVQSVGHSKLYITTKYTVTLVYLWTEGLADVFSSFEILRVKNDCGQTYTDTSPEQCVLSLFVNSFYL